MVSYHTIRRRVGGAANIRSECILDLLLGEQSEFGRKSGLYYIVIVKFFGKLTSKGKKLSIETLMKELSP